MAACREIITDALKSLKAIAPGNDPTADELNLGLEAIEDLLLDLHEARGPMADVDVTADYIAGENQRVRVQQGFTVNVTLPNSVPLYYQPDPYDYGFIAPTQLPPPGSIGQADGISWRQPRDGTRVEIVGTTQALYFYRADINAWLAASGVTLDQELPLNDRYDSAFAALVGERMMESLPDFDEPTPGFARRVQRAQQALFLRFGTARAAVQADYF